MMIRRVLKVFRTHLAARSALWLLAIVTLVGAIFLLLIRELTAELETQRQLTQLEELLDTVQSTTSIAVFLEDRELASEVASGLLNNHTVSSVDIWSDDTLIAREGEPRSDEDSETQAEVESTLSREITSPFNPEEVIGRIALVPNLEVIDTITARTVRFVSVMLLVLMTAIAAGVFFVVFRQITRPILNISRRLHQLQAEAGEKLDFPRGNETDEIGRLVRDVNALIDNLVDRLRQEEQLRRHIEVEKERFRTIYENAGTGIFQVDHTGRLLSCNTAFRDTFALRHAPEEQPTALAALLDMNEETLVKLLEQGLSARHPIDTSLEIPDPNAPPDTRWVHILLNPLGDNQLQGVVNDITESKQSEQAAQSLAVTDALTGLYNRLGFERELEHLIEHGPHQPEQRFSLLMIDLDHFKPVNDTYGHPAGDRLLKEVGERLGTCVRTSDITARLGGDEFAILLHTAYERETLTGLVEKIVSRLHEPFDIDEGVTVQIGASVGIATFGVDADNARELVAHADQALYAAKAAGRNTYRFHETEK